MHSEEKIANEEIKEEGQFFIYKGYEVTTVKADEEDRTPAWNSIDGRNGKPIILVLETVPAELVEPLIEHEIWEIEHDGDHEGALTAGRQKAEELGVSDEFSEFEKYWLSKIKK